jgi:hypothetical protein
MVPRWTLPRWTRIGWAIGLLLLAFTAGLARYLDASLKPKTWPWIHGDTLQARLFVALALATFLDAAWRTWLRFTRPPRTKTRVEIRNQLFQLVATISTVAEVPIGEIGCGLFVIQPRGIFRKQRLQRIERVRIIDDVSPSVVNFTKGKGAVGRCWEEARPAHNDWRAINSKYHAASPTDEDFAKFKPTTTKGFERKEFVSLVGKYSEVLAVPIVNDGKFLGCVAVPRPRVPVILRASRALAITSTWCRRRAPGAEALGRFDHAAAADVALGALGDGSAVGGDHDAGAHSGPRNAASGARLGLA